MGAHEQPSSFEARRLATELEALLRARGEKNWARGVCAVKEALGQSSGMAEAAATYRSILSGSGSFSDFYFHSDDSEERRRLNEPLDRLRSQLWRALEP